MIAMRKLAYSRPKSYALLVSLNLFNLHNGEQVIVGLIIVSSGSRDYSLESGKGDSISSE